MDKSKSPFVQEDLNEDTGFLLLQTSRLWDEFHERALKRHYNLSSMQYAVLASVYWCLLHNNKEITQTFLAHHTKIDPMTISQIFKVLEKKGYISRRTNSEDIRAKSVSLTDTGEALMQKAVATIANTDTKFFSILGKERTKMFNQCMVALINDND
ncbi:MAG: MarR family transcriptional regulator [Prevotellaceae bacterium]|jgi:DNA-binding MarR family transcriptional regulator|nr:MarR family transcriptional regulator [Prevotellaceae bacterium]